jgi:hypothetical protein
MLLPLSHELTQGHQKRHREQQLPTSFKVQTGMKYFFIMYYNKALLLQST